MEPDSVQKVAESDIVAEKNTESNDGFGLLLRGFFTKKGLMGCVCFVCTPWGQGVFEGWVMIRLLLEY